MASPPTTFCVYCFNDIPDVKFVKHFEDCQDELVRKSAIDAGVPEDIARLFIESVADCADAHEIVEGLYLGSAKAARDVDFLRSAGISAIVNAAAEIDLPEELLAGAGIRNIYRLNMRDLDIFDPTEAIHKGIGYITDHTVAGQKVLVHCAVGASRSASVAIAYLMKHHKMTFKDAFWHTKCKRTVVSPNLGFMLRLLRYEKDLYGAVSIPRKALKLHRLYQFAFDNEAEAQSFITEVMGADYE